MQADSVALLALNELRRTLETPHTMSALSAEISTFASGFLGVDTAELVASTPADLHLGALPGRLEIPLPGSPLLLRLERSTAFQPKEVALAELLASIITATPHHIPQTNVPIIPFLESISSDQSTQLQGLYNLMATAGVLRPLPPTLADIHAQVMQICDAPSFFVTLIDPESDQLTFPYAVFQHKPQTIAPLPLDDEESLAAWVVRHNSSFITADWPNADRPVPGVSEEHISAPRSVLWLPLRAGNEVVGALSVQSDAPAAFDESTYRVLHTLADHVAIILKNAQLYATMQKLVDKVVGEYLISSALRQAITDLSTTLNLDEALDRLLQGLAEVVPLDSASVGLLVNNQLTFYAHRPHPAQTVSNEELIDRANQELAHNPLIWEAIERRRPLVLADVLDSPRWHTMVAADYIRSWMAVPLVVAGNVVGVITIDSGIPNTYSDREAWLVQTLATQAALAINNARLHEKTQNQLVENAELFAQAQRRIQELSAFHEIVLRLSTPLELEELLEYITEAALELIDATNLHIYLYDHERQEFTFCSALWRDGRRTPAVTAPRPDGITMSVIQSGQQIVIDNAPKHPLFQTETASNWGVQAIAGFPLKHNNQVIGAFTATYLQPHSFSPEELLLMKLLADQAAVAVENARLFANARERLAYMSALVEVAKQVTGNLRLDSVMQTTVQMLKDLFNARASTIALLTEDEDELQIAAGAGIKPEFQYVRIPMGLGVSGRVVDTQQAVYVADTYTEENFLFFDEIVRSLLAVPLIHRGDILGTLTVDSDRPNAFTESDIQLMTIAAAQVSIAISHARLFEQLEARAVELTRAYAELQENDRLKDELVQNVSHELRTPLTFVRGYVDLLLEGDMGLLNESQTAALKIVSDKTDEITRLVADIMSLQRINADSLILESFSLPELLKYALNVHKVGERGENIAFQYSAIYQDGIIEADKGRLNQVLDNLLGNAIKFSLDQPQISLRMVEREKDIIVTVEDKGIGMAPDKTERIFDRFYQADGSSRRRFGGAGLGLAIVKRIVDAHSGDIWVRSEEGQGSTFYMVLPRTFVRTKEQTPLEEMLAARAAVAAAAETDTTVF